MKKIVFIWSNNTISGTIIGQAPHSLHGLKTTIRGDDGVDYILYGQCRVGNCGPFNVLSIS